MGHSEGFRDRVLPKEKTQKSTFPRDLDTEAQTDVLKERSGRPGATFWEPAPKLLYSPSQTNLTV